MKTQKLLLFVLIITAIQSNLFAQKDSSDFVFTIKTDNPGITSDSSFQISTQSFFNSCDFDVDWDNDGVFDTLGVDSTITHNYDSSGVYTIRLRGNFRELRLGGGTNTDRSKLISVDQWDVSSVTNMNSMFYSATSFDQPLYSWNLDSIVLYVR